MASEQGKLPNLKNLSASKRFVTYAYRWSQIKTVFVNFGFDMLSTSTSPEIEHLIKEVVKEDSRYVRSEMRSVHRENLVVPVTMIFKDGLQQEAFSRNISPAGVCLISREPVTGNETVELEIYRLNGKKQQIIAEARWCKPFGPEYFMSGWKFVQLKRR